MSVVLLGTRLAFPSPDAANEDGLLAVGGDASPERLLLGYAQGIFAWPSPGLPLLWFSPDPRYVVLPARAHVPHSLRKTIRRAPFEVRFDTVFDAVVANCASASRPGQNGTWITAALRDGFVGLHRRGVAHSVEAFHGSQLVGGLFGVSLGGVFFGESMFSLEPDASKVAFVTLLGHMTSWGHSLVDCQVETSHLARFGGEAWPRTRFLETLGASFAVTKTRFGPWNATLSPADALGRVLARGA